MNLKRKTGVAILAWCLLLSTNGNHSTVVAAENRSHSIEQQQDFEPSHIFPEKQLYEIEEGETLVITFNVIFPALSGGCIETVAYEALPPKPGFVAVTQTFQREFKKFGNVDPYIHQMALLVLSPQQGDAGRYEIRIQEKLCPQSAGTILPINVHVKRVNFRQRRQARLKVRSESTLRDKTN